MVWFILVGALAAFGALSALWAIFGWLLPAGKQGVLICAGSPDGIALARRCLWLRSMGFLDCPLLLVSPDDADRPWLEDEGVEICSLEELPLRLGIGESEN